MAEILDLLAAKDRKTPVLSPGDELDEGVRRDLAAYFNEQARQQKPAKRPKRARQAKHIAMAEARRVAALECTWEISNLQRHALAAWRQAVREVPVEAMEHLYHVRGLLARIGQLNSMTMSMLDDEVVTPEDCREALDGKAP